MRVTKQSSNGDLKEQEDNIRAMDGDTERCASCTTWSAVWFALLFCSSHLPTACASFGLPACHSSAIGSGFTPRTGFDKFVVLEVEAKRTADGELEGLAGLEG